MSFILDALKKSEQERERQQPPAVMDIPYGRRSRTPPMWLIIVIGLLLLNCVLLLVMWLRNSSVQPVVVVAPTASVSASSAANSAAINSAPSATTISNLPRPTEVRPLQDEATRDAETADETETTLANADIATGPPLVRPATGLEQAVAQQEASANNLKAQSLNNATFSGTGNTNASNTDNLPTLDSLGGSGSLNLPNLRLDIHVYSSVAAERFAFINSHKYTEGQNLSEGPHLDKITADGVVLSYRNQRFLLPRQ